MRRPTTSVVPAKAGTHNHRWLLVGEVLPQAAGTFRLATTEAMGPRLRGDDTKCVAPSTQIGFPA